jgi:hypothetical protein
MSEGTAPEKAGRVAISGKQAGAENSQRLRAYLAALRSGGRRLPSRGGKPDKSAIAVACGFNRQTLYNNPEAISLLDEAVKEFGLEGENNAAPGGKTEFLRRQVDKRERRVRRLEELLDTRNAENQTLRRENKELKEKLRQYELTEEIMTTSGRRFRP